MPLAANSNKVDADFLGDVGAFDPIPQFVEHEQALGDQERHHHLRQRRAFLVGHVERDARAEAIDEAVGDLRRDDLVLQAMSADGIGVALAHGFGECGEKLFLHRRVVGQLQSLGCLLQRDLGHRQHDRQLRPRQSAIFLRAAQQLFAVGQALDPAIEPAAGLQKLDRPHLAWERARSTRLGDGQCQRLQPIILEHQRRHFVGHPGQQRVALGFAQPALGHLAVERDLDVYFIVRAIDPRRIVDEVAVDAPAELGEFDPRRLGDRKVRALADGLGADLAGIDTERVVGRVADRAVRLGGGLHIGANPAEPDEVDLSLENRVDQLGRIDSLGLYPQRGARLLGKVDRLLGARENRRLLSKARRGQNRPNLIAAG